MLICLNIILIIAFLVSWYGVIKNRDDCTFIYSWGFIVYAFVWEDLLIFSLFFLGLVNAAGIFHDFRIVYLGMLIFYCVRSAGETLYYFLQQFIQPTHHPHDVRTHVKALQKVFGEISYQKSLIFIQVIQQVTLVVALTLLVFLLMNWSSVPKLL